MNYFSTQTLEAMAELDQYDIAYCKKLAKRFESMGISQKTGSKALKHLSEQQSVPQFISKAGFPSFGFHLFKQA